MLNDTALPQSVVLRMAALMLISWGGELIHNLLEFPNMGLLAVENSGTLLFSVILFVIWRQIPGWRRITLAVIGAWGLVHLLIGAIITVIPFGFLPFAPEQSLSHYISHLIYGAAQIPLLVYIVGEIRQTEAAS